MKRKDICNILGISRSTVSRIINGKTRSALMERVKFLINFEETISEIMRREDFEKLCKNGMKSKKRSDRPVVMLALKGIQIYNILNLPNSNHYSDLLDREISEFINSGEFGDLCSMAVTSEPEIVNTVSELLQIKTYILLK